jgi:hypothetical protein
MRRITRRLKAAKPLVCVPFLVGVCLTAAGQVHAQTVYRYEVRDPLTGAGVTDLNTVFWRWTGPSFAGCAAPSATVSGAGIALSGQLSGLGTAPDASGPSKEWLIRGDFRIAVSLLIPAGSRSHFSVTSYQAGQFVRVDGVSGRGLPSMGLTIQAFSDGAEVHYLLKKEGGRLTIHRGRPGGVDESDPVVASGSVNASNDVAVYAQTGCPTTGTMRIRDFHLQAQEIVIGTSARSQVPPEWRASADLASCQTDGAAIAAQRDAALAELAACNGKVSSLSSDVLALTQQNQALAEQNLGLLDALDAANARNTQLQSALVAAQQSAAQQTVFVTDQIQALVNDLRATFRNAAFVLPGATPFEQLRNLVNAIIELNRGRKEGLYANLGGRL